MYKITAEIGENGIMLRGDGNGEGKTTLLQLIQAGNGIIEALADLAEKDVSEFTMMMTLMRISSELKDQIDNDDEEDDEDA